MEAILKLDIDFPVRIPNRAIIEYLTMKKLMEVRAYIKTISKFYHVKKLEVYNTSKGIHLEIMLEEQLTKEQIQLLQAPIDDKMRNLFNALRLIGKIKGTWNLLFKEKWKFEKGKLKLIHKRTKNKLLTKWFSLCILVEKTDKPNIYPSFKYSFL